MFLLLLLLITSLSRRQSKILTRTAVQAVAVFFIHPLAHGRPPKDPTCSAGGMQMPTAIGPILVCSEQQKGFQASLHIKETYCLANPYLPDCPLTHISLGFTELTGGPQPLLFLPPSLSAGCC